MLMKITSDNTSIIVNKRLSQYLLNDINIQIGKDKSEHNKFSGLDTRISSNSIFKMRNLSKRRMENT